MPPQPLTSDDLELLRLSASAAGIPLIWLQYEKVWYCANPGQGDHWNPLESREQAFDLQVSLHLAVSVMDGKTVVGGEGDEPVQEAHGKNPALATMRAITRAAALKAPVTAG